LKPDSLEAIEESCDINCKRISLQQTLLVPSLTDILFVIPAFMPFLFRLLRKFFAADVALVNYFPMFLQLGISGEHLSAELARTFLLFMN
jgi:hypothetical protein